MTGRLIFIAVIIAVTMYINIFEFGDSCRVRIGAECLRVRFDFSRGLVYGSASDRLRARGLFESFAIGSARGAAPNGCWQLALAVSSPQSHRHVALEELIIPRCSGSPSDHLG
jgi:hypothetical protein